MIELRDEEILLRLTNFEDAFVERKSTGDMRDLLKTAVAFANSTPIGYPAILFYGVTDKGVPEGKANLDSLQKTISDKLSDAYPPIFYLSKVLQQDDKQFLAILIPGSEDRPHFAGQSYIRDGSQSKEASGRQFEQLIAERNSKTREILKWRQKEISVYFRPSESTLILAQFVGSRAERTVIDCNQFYVTLEKLVENEHAFESFPLADLEIGFDNNANRLELRMKRR
jgi:hypothetical protein